jgi:hypothetical protein
LIVAGAPDRECVEHYKARRAAETAELAVLYPDLPPLIGSVGQVGWANKIRVALVHQLTLAIAKAHAPPTPKKGNLAAHIDRQIAGRCLKDEAKLAEYRSETDARYFINPKFLQRRDKA